MVKTSTKTKSYLNHLETDKHQHILSDKETTNLVRDMNRLLENSLLDSGVVVYELLEHLKKRMPNKHYFKLCGLITKEYPEHKGIIQLSLYTTEGEVQIPLLTLNQGVVKLYLLSEGGNVSTLTRLTYKFIRLLFEIRHCSKEDVRYRLIRKRNKAVKSDQSKECALLQSNGETHD